MKRALIVLFVVVLALGAGGVLASGDAPTFPGLEWQPSRVFIGGEVISHRFTDGEDVYVVAIPYLSLGGIYPSILHALGSDTHRIKLIGALSLSDPTRLQSWYQASLTGLIRLTPEFLWLGGGTRLSAHFRDFRFDRAGWSVFGEVRATWNDFLSGFVRLHLPQWGVATTDPFWGVWLTFGASIEF